MKQPQPQPEPSKTFTNICAAYATIPDSGYAVE